MNHKVFVVDTNKRPLAPCHPARARQLLSRKKAAVYLQYPFTIILSRAIDNVFDKPLRLKLDPGSRTTGIAIVNDATGEIDFAAELNHRGQIIKADIDSRRAIRRSRRSRKTRYRKPRFNNRKRAAGWLPPSLMSRVYNIDTWVARLIKLCPITVISVELARFDTQKLINPEVSGIKYQQGELKGYEIREYLLEKWGRKCVYCGTSNLPLQVEHIIPKAIRVDNRVSNLTISCKECNQKKGTLTAAEFGFPQLHSQAKKPLHDAAAVNATRWEIYRRLQGTGLPVEVGTGGRTKFNRIQRGLPKTHWLDAVCVGRSTPETLFLEGTKPLIITANGHGNRRMCGTNKYGFPIRHRKRQKKYFGFQTGDIVLASVPCGKKKGRHIGRVMVRASGSFDIRTKAGRISGINRKYCRVVHSSDGYNYN